MGTNYNRFAGQSIERLAELSDGIFAVAMTLLVLNLHVPAIPAKMGKYPELDLLHALVHVAPNLLSYFLSFLTLGIFWLSQQIQLHNFARSNRDLTWIQLGFLLVVSLIPFSTGLLAAYITYRLALVIYWFNILLLGIILAAGWQYARHAGLLREGVTDTVQEAAMRRIIQAQTLYAVSTALCVINTYVSIILIVLIQINIAVAPRVRLLNQL